MAVLNKCPKFQFPEPMNEDNDVIPSLTNSFLPSGANIIVSCALNEYYFGLSLQVLAEPDEVVYNDESYQLKPVHNVHFLSKYLQFFSAKTLCQTTGPLEIID
ncbi:hypothetical protein DERP_005594 [Dermatophagoides pteronyssinus]|uniref:Uncharacterized protein n=1 Tax=Dermatophagoides pteronyssinus TaxID=6956 RepID=A0ABQ8J906_DERPT|nr:hypothetical protein DERP_005594 [Dermatophagoides pteronyssinus]